MLFLTMGITFLYYPDAIIPPRILPHRLMAFDGMNCRIVESDESEIVFLIKSENVE